MNYLRQIQRGVEYIEAHLDGEIETADVARHAGISHWHFQRIFKALTRETLKSYIRARRMAGALESLSRTDARVLDIALSAGFETQESFTRAFKKAFGVTPAAYRRHGSRFQFVRKLRVDAEYLSHLHAGVSMEPEVYQQPAMTLVGVTTRFFSVDSEKNNLARRLPPLWNDFLSRVGEVEHPHAGVCYGVVQQTSARTDELQYHAAIEVSRAGRVPRGMVAVHVPAGRYARFTHVGRSAHVDKTVSYIYGTWLPQSGMRHTYAADLEFYDARYHPDSDDSVIQYAIPVSR